MQNSQPREQTMSEITFVRLSDKIFDAFKVALEQDALETATHLYNALETSLTRKTGGLGFVEKRGDIRPDILDAIKEYKSKVSAK